MEDKEFVCCICGGTFIGFGNNPYGAMCKDKDGNIIDMNYQFNDGSRCCNECDNLFVIPGRIYRLAQRKEND